MLLKHMLLGYTWMCSMMREQGPCTCSTIMVGSRNALGTVTAVVYGRRTLTPRAAHTDTDACTGTYRHSTPSVPPTHPDTPPPPPPHPPLSLTRVRQAGPGCGAALLEGKEAWLCRPGGGDQNAVQGVSHAGHGHDVGWGRVEGGGGAVRDLGVEHACVCMLLHAHACVHVRTSVPVGVCACWSPARLHPCWAVGLL